MRNSVAFIAAPYGFGPSSKAIAISSHLPRSVERVFLSDGPALAMARSSNEFSSCVRLDFSARMANAAERLSSFGVLIFINSTRFITASVTRGRPTILVETLAWLRDERPSCASLLSAYFAQRFFHYAFGPELESMDNFYAVGAIVPESISTAVAPNVSGRSSVQKSPIVHCGGLFSPAMIEGAEQEFVARTFSAVGSLNEPVRAILPAHLHSVFQKQLPGRMSLLDCSSLSIHEHILGSEFSLTTTGIEFTYESMLLGVPTLFLPPFNASQCFQLDYHWRACAECVPFKVATQKRAPGFLSLHEATAEIQQVGMAGSWRAQFADVSYFLHRVLPMERKRILHRIRESQQKAIEGIGTDGAQRIASHALSEVGLELALQ